MKSSKKFVCMLLAFALLALTACGGSTAEIVEPMSAETLLEKTSAAMKEQEMTSGHADMAMDMSITADGETMDMAMDMEMDILVSTDPYAAYTKMVMDMTMLGESMTETTEQYILVEDGTAYAYSYVESYDTWTVTEVPMDETAMMQSEDYNWLADLDPAEVTLAEETELLNEKEVYVLRCTVTGEDMESSLSMMEDSLAGSGMAGLDMSSLEIPVTLWIDAVEYRVVQMEMDMQGMEKFINDMFQSMLGSITSEMDGDLFSISFDEISYVFSDLGYDPVVVPPLPEGAKESAIEMDESLLEESLTQGEESTGMATKDNVYTIEEGAYQVDIACPEGWYVEEITYDSLTIARDDDVISGYYLMFDEGDRDSSITMIEQDVIQAYIDDGTYVDHGTGETINGMHTMWLTMNDGYNMYFAFGDTYGGWLYVDVLCYGSSDMHTALTDILGNIVPDSATGESV